MKPVAQHCFFLFGYAIGMGSKFHNQGLEHIRSHRKQGVLTTGRQPENSQYNIIFKKLKGSLLP